MNKQSLNTPLIKSEGTDIIQIRPSGELVHFQNTVDLMELIINQFTCI